ncbi:hypothetical protein GQ53DRAFT_669403 [Thozetella sp. PMI_491]|nr:hypothetical protein GQ53DRAFT_669403 [Thozetella sp. PMI_491]
MQLLRQDRDDACTPLGHRRGFSDLARFALDLTGARADSVSAAHSGGYPSPPMSGSPPLPPKATQEAAERNQGAYQTTTIAATTQDVHRSIPATEGDVRLQAGGATALPRPPYGGEPPQERMHFPFARPEVAMPRPLSYPPQHGPTMGQHYLPHPGTVAGASGQGPVPQAYSGAPQPPPPESPSQTSPKTQRKTKGHVASACVPCKRAHLRCDAQRPCSRCLNNGKEDQCVDVQHKKRGRPRLRDDRERFDPSRFSNAPDSMMRRPLSLFGAPGPSMGMAYDDNLRRTQSYRVLKSHPVEPIAPRFPERASLSGANVYPAPSLSIATRAPERIPEPAAYLTMDMEVAKASSTFVDALGRATVRGQRLVDLVMPGDREKWSICQRQLHEEQRMKEPTYLPPIFGKQEQERVMQSLGFTPEELSRYPLDRHEYLTFMGQDGQPRGYPIRIGLAKQDSIYFVVIALETHGRLFQAPPTPSPNLREVGYAYQQMPQPYSQPTPVSATFDPRQARLGEPGYGSRQGAQPQGMMTTLSPGVLSSYAASPSRPDYPGSHSSYQIPRSELPPASRAPQTPGYQLPPIRDQQPPSQDPSYHPRDDRSRVDIGGLIDRPEQPRGPRQ